VIQPGGGGGATETMKRGMIADKDLSLYALLRFNKFGGQLLGGRRR